MERRPVQKSAHSPEAQGRLTPEAGPCGGFVATMKRCTERKKPYSIIESLFQPCIY